MQQTLRRLRAWRRWLGRWWRGVDNNAEPAQPLGAGPVLATAPAAAPGPALSLPLAPCVSVVIPALNEAEHIAEVVRFALADALTAEVIVIDDSSLDDTAVLARRAGARVVTSTMLGKGASMQDGAHEAQHGLVIYLDGDLKGLRPGLISDMCQPLLNDRADFVKARFGRGGGRVTELTAKPMLKVFFPELAGFGQPLGGIVAARRSLLRQLPFEPDYGVDIGLLIDAQRGGARLAEVDIGSLQHDSQSLQDLGAMANEVARVIYTRAREAGRLHAEQIVAMYESQRQAASSLEYVLSRRRGQLRLLLISMDALLEAPGYLPALAEATGQSDALARVVSMPDGEERAARTAALMRFVHRQQFDRVARTVPVRAGVVELVNRMRRCGFMVGVLSDDWFLAAETVRRRVFADFALGHTLQFDGDTCTGEVLLNPAFRPLQANDGAALCKSHVLRRLRAESDAVPLLANWAIGSNAQDLPLLRLVNPGFLLPALSAPSPRSPAPEDQPGLRVISSFAELLDLVPAPQPRHTESA